MRDKAIRNGFNAYLYASFCSGRAPAPQKTSVFFRPPTTSRSGGTLRAKGYSYF